MIGADHPPRQRVPDKKKGELLFDVLLVIAIATYLAVARGYPPIGRQVPTVVGVVALVAAVVQLIGYFVPGLWTFTHGGTPTDELRTTTSVGRTGLAAAGVTAAEESEEAESAPPHQTRDTAVAMAWAGGFLASILAVGYVLAIPLFFLAYFGSRRSWRLAIGSAVAMGLITYFLFQVLLGIPLPTGLLPGG